jgi:superfamily II DNA/RNA helicase
MQREESATPSGTGFPVLSFDDMGLHDNLLRGIYAYGFERPSEIQQRGIVPLTRHRDVVGLTRPVRNRLSFYFS